MTNNLQKKLTLFALGLVIVVIGLGAFTRLVDAGLGCPDWPGCYGHIGIPMKEHTIAKVNQAFPEQPYDFHKAWPEMVHRYFAGTLGLVILSLFVIAIKRRQQPDAALKLSTGLALLIAFQAALGAWTVTEKLHPFVVMGHLLGGFTTFCLLTVLALRLFKPMTDITDALAVRNKTWVTVAIVIVALQIALGGWTSANYAALVCTDLPICFDGWTAHTNFSEGFTFLGHEAETYQYGIFSNEAKVAIHVSHRIGAIITAIVVSLLAIRLLRQNNLTLKRAALVILGLLLLQICLGVSNVIFSLPLPVAVAHNLVAALLIVSLVALRTKLWLTQCYANGETL
jgi:cytochrome c oxidase assembly protein subunit 15